MKNILLIFCVSFISCVSGPRMKKKYNFELTYTNGSIDTVSYSGVGENLFTLEHSDFKILNNKTLISGVRTYKLLSVQNLGFQTKAEISKTGCGCGGSSITRIEKPKVVVTQE